MVNALSHKAVLANLTFESWGTKRHDDEATEETLTRKGAEKHAGLFTKRLLNKKAMQGIRSVRNAARKYHKAKTSPWLDDGTRILPTIFYGDYSTQMSKFKSEFEQAVSEFIKEYPQYIKQARKELGGLFNDQDYPQVGLIKSKFSFDVVILPYPDTQDFRVNMDDDDIKDIKRDLEKRLEAQVKETIKNVAERLNGVIGHMANKLKEYKPGNKERGIKAKNTFRDSLVGNVQELADLIQGLNMTDDPKLEAIRKKVVKDLCSVKPEDLREDEIVRKKVLTSANQILKDVSSFIM